MNNDAMTIFQQLAEIVSLRRDLEAAIARAERAEAREFALKNALLHFVDDAPPEGKCTYCIGYEAHKPYCPYTVAQHALAATGEADA